MLVKVQQERGLSASGVRIIVGASQRGRTKTRKAVNHTGFSQKDQFGFKKNLKIVVFIFYCYYKLQNPNLPTQTPSVTLTTRLDCTRSDRDFATAFLVESENTCFRHMYVTT